MIDRKLATSLLITEDLLHGAIKQHQRKTPPLSQVHRLFEQQYLIQLLLTTNGNVSQAARIAKRNCSVYSNQNIKPKQLCITPFSFVAKLRLKRSTIFFVSLK
jgi:hypothetical protein